MYAQCQAMIQTIKTELLRKDINDAYRKTLEATLENLYTLSMFN